MALFLQNGTPLLLQNGEPLLLQSDNLAVIGPFDLSVRDEDFATLELTVASNDPGSLTYQWYRNAVLIPLATDASYVFVVDYLTDDQSTYYCEVTDSSGTVQSDTATLTVTKKVLEWTTQPADATTVENVEVSFFAEADTGTFPATYQWYEEIAGLLVGETATTLTFTPTLGQDQEGYYLEATDQYGDVWNSDIARLTVVAEQGLAKHDLRMKNPAGQWIEILNHDFWGERHVDTSGTAPVANDSIVWIEERNRWETLSEAGGPLSAVLTIDTINATNIGTTWQEMDRITVPETTAYDFKLEATAKQQGVTDEFFLGWYGGMVYRDLGGAVFIQNVETIMQKTTDNQTQLRVIIDGNDFVIQVKSRNATTWDWKALIKVRLLWEF